MRTHNGNISKAVADIGMLTLEMLSKFDIPYHEISFGKPHAHYYIDDLAINAYHDLEKATGFYQNGIEPRGFHTLTLKNAKVFRKNGCLKSQINYYLNIPSSVRLLFPSLLDYDDVHFRWYDMQYIEGLTMSNMFVSQLMSQEHMHTLMQNLQKIRGCTTEIKINIYGNYARKLKKRFEEYCSVYSTKTNCQNVYATLVEKLDEYELKQRGKCGMIHGDPVFTNIMLVDKNKFKFIDMRGRVDDSDTIMGDIFYDYAKVYQSLSGYDEILFNVRVEQEYRGMMVNIFKEYAQEYFNDIVLLTSSMLFSLLPLHDKNHEKFYDLAVELLVGIQ
jgi:hypothetical protein